MLVLACSWHGRCQGVRHAARCEGARMAHKECMNSDYSEEEFTYKCYTCTFIYQPNRVTSASLTFHQKYYRTDTTCLVMNEALIKKEIIRLRGRVDRPEGDTNSLWEIKSEPTHSAK